MAILWAGGEDHDFPNGPLVITTDSSYFRSSYARCATDGGSMSAKSTTNPFPAGGVTTCWMGFRGQIGFHGFYGKGVAAIGIGKLDGTAFKGFLLGSDVDVASKIALYKFDGNNATWLAAESSTSWTSVLSKYDIQVTDYGNNANIKVYHEGSSDPVLDYSGNMEVGVANLDRVAIWPMSGSYSGARISEIVVASEDTRSMSVRTHHPNGNNNCTNEWSGNYADINEVTLSDTSLIYTDTSGNTFQAELADSPAGNFYVKAAVISARCYASNDAVPTKVKLGIKSGNNTDDGTAQTLSTTWDNYIRIMSTNPTTGSAFNTTELDDLKVQLKSST